MCLAQQESIVAAKNINVTVAAVPIIVFCLFNQQGPQFLLDRNYDSDPAHVLN
jgi:hypothetical protein